MTDEKGRHCPPGDPDDVSITPLPTSWIQDAITNTPDRKRQVHSEAKLLVSLGHWVLPVKKLGKGYPEKQFNANSATKSPKKVDEWFHPDKGKYAGYNIAIPCGFKEGNAVVVADADCHGRADGVKEWNDLVKTHGELDKHPWAKTPNDGEHHFFQWHSAFTKKSTRLHQDSGLEILGGKDGSFTSFVLVYPSVVKDRKGIYKQYKWQVHPKDCQPPPTPDWLSRSLSASRQQSKGDGKGSENVSEADLEQIISQDQIERMLAVIHPDELSYSEWLTIGMAINSQHHDALHIWDEWSRRGDRYKSDECENRWQGITAGGSRTRVTIGTLFYHARKFGWKPVENDTHCNAVSLAVAKLNQTYAHVVVGGHERILRLRPDHRRGDLHYDLLVPIAFRGLFPGEFVKNPNWQKAKKLPDAWLDSPHRRSYPYGLRLCPNKSPPFGFFNTWDGFAFEPQEGNCSLFLDHVRNVICNGNDQLYSWVVDWCADCVQDPANLKGTAIVMRGREGTGKGTFAETIGELFGSHYVHLIDRSHLTGNFNAHLIDAIFVYADEITWGGHRKEQGKLKGLVTERRLVGERKGIDAIPYRNYAHFIIASNEEWVIPAGSNSRRWCVLDIDDSHANEPSYFNPIYKELANGGYEALLHHLQNHQIESNLRHAPATAALADQRRLSAESQSKFFEYLDQRLGENSWGKSPFVEHADYGLCLIKSYIYVDYRQFCEMLRGTPWSDMRFWKQWLKVFPYARGSQTDWPRTRSGSVLTRVAVIRPRPEMCKEFTDYFGTASDEVKTAATDWLQEDEGI